VTIEFPAIRISQEPMVWASPPEWMSFSKLQQIEACPRRWSLMSSDYPAIWGKNGYPEPLIQSTLIGRVTHRLVEIIVKEFQRAGCTSFDNPDCIRVMRGLGGFSRIIEKIFDDVLIQYAENTRAAGTLTVIKKALLERKSDIRENARILLSRIFEGKQTAQCVSLVSQGKVAPLRNGIYSEVQLVNEEIKWKGVADLIRLTPEECEIRDFKTGVHKEEHAEQLRIYNLLWLCDNRKNPSAHPASKLTISYIDADVVVSPLLISEVAVYKDKLINLTNEAKKKVTECPPEAILNEDNCRHCFVRHLCTLYWEKGLPKMFAKEKTANSLIDIAVRIVGIHGSRSYDAVTIASSNLPQNMPLILRISENCNFKRGNCLRLLNFSMKRDETNEDKEQVVISPSKISEYYFMPEL
jgi:hypothetical protein